MITGKQRRGYRWNKLLERDLHRHSVFLLVFQDHHDFFLAKESCSSRFGASSFPSLDSARRNQQLKERRLRSYPKCRLTLLELLHLMFKEAV